MEKVGPRQTRPLLSVVLSAPVAADDADALARRVAAAAGRVPYELLFDVEGAAPGTSSAPVRGAIARLSAAKGALVCVMSAGTEAELAELPRLLRAVRDADLVVASRRIPGGDAGAASLGRRAGDGLRGGAACALFRRARACSDPLSPLFIVRRAVLEGVSLRAADGRPLLAVLVRGRWSRLSEIPYAAEPPARRARAAAESGAEYVRELGALRFTGRRGTGAVRYRRHRVPVGPDDPQPLDDDLPDDPEIAGARRRRLLWAIGLVALALRLALLPLGHPWDVTVDYNVFVDLAHNASPYNTMVYLSHIAYAGHWDTVYEYYAYPPVPLYLYWPLAHLFAWLHPGATYFIPVSGTFALPNLPWDFYLWLKLPIWIADFLVAAVLARMAGTIRGWRDYLLNPFVLLVSGMWTFDAVMLLGLVLGVYYAQKGRFVASGVALAFGTMIKFFPALAVPTILLFMLKKQRPLREMATFVAAYAVACAAFVGPFLGDLLYEVSFHGGRVGGGMNWEMITRLGDLFPKYTPLDPISLAVAAFGTPMLVIALLLGYWYAYINKEMGLNRMLLVTLLAFLLGSKLVNEQYALLVVPFALLEARRVRGAWIWLARLLWIVPLAYAIMRVPIGRFLWLFYHTMFGAQADKIALTGLTGLDAPFFPWMDSMTQAVLIGILGVGFWALCLVALVWPVRPAKPLRRDDPLAAAPRRHTAPAIAAVAALAGEADDAPRPEVAAAR